MRVSDWISAHPGLPSTISVDSSFYDVFSVMLAPPFQRDVYVVSKDNHLVGYLSLKKIAKQLLPAYQSMHSRRQIVHRIAGCTMKDLMQTEFSFAKPDEELEDIFHLLLEQDVEELPVISETGTLTGVLKLTSLLPYLLDNEKTDTLCKI